MRAVTHQPSFHSCPLAALAAALAVGIACSRYVPVPLTWFIALGAVATLAACVLVACWPKRLRAATWCVIAAVWCLGVALWAAEGGRVTPQRVARMIEDGRIEAGAPVELTGVLERAPEPAPDGMFLVLRVEALTHKATESVATGSVELFAPVRDAAAGAAYEKLELRRGARVRVLTALARGERYRNPGGSSLKELLGRRGVDATGAIKSPLLIERLDDEQVFVPLVWLEAWRAWMHMRLSQLFTRETAGVLQAALLGNRHGLSRAAAERFRAGGTFHVLVISGLHISFIGGLALVLTRRVTRRRAWQFACACALLWAYALAVGAGASVVRAAFMFTLVALAPVLGRRASSLNALGAAALLLLVWQPDDLFDPSFQLTFLSVFAIVALAWPLLANLRAVGAWRLTRATPYPPRCPRPWRALGETLFWGERAWRHETAQTLYSYRLFKTPAAHRLERLKLQRPLRYIIGAIVVSLAVQLVMLPLLVLYFHRVSLASLVLNVVVGALMASLALAALGAILLSVIHQPLAQPLVWLAERLNWWMTHSVDPFARVGVASLRLPEYAGTPSLIYALYFAPLVVLLVALAHWRPLAHDAGDDAITEGVEYRRVLLAGVSFVTLSLFILLHPFSAVRADAGRLRVDFLDVGQGDAVLVTFPDDTTLLIDGGGRTTFRANADDKADDAMGEAFAPDTRGVGESVVCEYLWWRGLDHVDYLLATHAHADHMDGLNDVLRNFAVRAVFVARAPAANEEYARLAVTAREQAVPLRLLARGDALRFGAATADVLWPPRADDAGSSGGGDAGSRRASGNDDSLVLRLRYGARSFLLTGDLEADGEAALVDAREDLHCALVKVAHHGSRTSSTTAFVDATRPALAVVSVGLDSPFGHPAPEVVARWQAAGAQVLQTGRRGTGTVTTDGQDLRVQTFAPE